MRNGPQRTMEESGALAFLSVTQACATDGVEKIVNPKTIQQHQVQGDGDETVSTTARRSNSSKGSKAVHITVHCG